MKLTEGGMTEEKGKRKEGKKERASVEKKNKKSESESGKILIKTQGSHLW